MGLYPTPHMYSGVQKRSKHQHSPAALRGFIGLKMKKLLISILLMMSSAVFALPTSPSVTFGAVDPNPPNPATFNKYDGSVYVKTSDGTADGIVKTVWHYSIKNNRFVNTTIAPTMISKRLTSNVSSTAVARANVADWAFGVTAGKSYRIELVAMYQSASTTTGGSVGFVLTSGAGNVAGFVNGDVSVSTVATTLRAPIRSINATSTTAGSFLTTTGVSVINTPHSIHSVITLDCTTSGVFQVQWGSEVAGNASRLNAGSTMYVTEF